MDPRQRRAWQAGDRSEFAVFRFADAPRMEETAVMVGPDADTGAGLAGPAIEAGLLDGSQLRLLFAQSGPAPFTLVHVWFKPHLLLPRHRHNADCLYYVVSGSLAMGARELRAGDGFYVPAGTRYGYRAGPEGVEVLEIRTVGQFDIALDATPRRWDDVRDTVARHHDEWTALHTPPSVEGSTSAPGPPPPRPRIV